MAVLVLVALFVGALLAPKSRRRLTPRLHRATRLARPRRVISPRHRGPPDLAPSPSPGGGGASPTPPGRPFSDVRAFPRRPALPDIDAELSLRRCCQWRPIR